jgi:hypothetical protein
LALNASPFQVSAPGNARGTSPKALVKSITELDGTLNDGSKAPLYKIVVRSLPTEREIRPRAPKTIKNNGGYREDTVDKKLYRVMARSDLNAQRSARRRRVTGT